MIALDRKVVRFFMAFVLTYVAVICFLIDRHPAIDELGLYNPAYMFASFGKMTYPIHYYFDFMTVHPPVHYLEIGWLLKLGFSIYYAEMVVTFLLFFIAIAVIDGSAFSGIVKLAMVWGLFAATVLDHEWIKYAYSVRPDLNIAIAGFAGLMCLESARLRSWESRRELFLGGFLLSYASGLHYFAIALNFSTVIYAALIVKQVGWRRSLRVNLWLMSGAALFWLPYLIFFVIPYFEAIKQIVSAVQGHDKGPLDALAKHFAQYDHTYHGVHLGPLSTLVLEPFLKRHIPLVLFSSGVFLLFRQTRVLALASAPLTLFVMFYSQGKSSGYYILELMFFFFAFAVLVFFVMEWLILKMSSNRLKVLALLLCAGLSVWTLMPRKLFDDLAKEAVYRVHDGDVARSAGKKIVGPDAVVGGRIGLWFIAGASYWYDIASDLLWSKIKDKDIRDYFSRFDAIVEQYHMSNATSNDLGTVISSWYLDKTLFLKGFYFGREGNSSYLVFSPKPPGPLLGYAYKSNAVLRFDEDAAGDYLFLTYVSNTENMYFLKEKSAFFNCWPLPKSGDKPEQYLVSAVVPASDYQLEKNEFLKVAQIVDSVACRMSVDDRQAMIKELRKKDKPIVFFRKYEDLRSHSVS